MPAVVNSSEKFDRLRLQAEELIRQGRPMAVPPPDDILELIYELKIHQTELEIQNEELKRAQQEIADMHRQYERLYEFAPCGYVTLNPHGMITRVNLTAVELLGVAKKHLLQSALSRHIATDRQNALLEARINSAHTGENQSVDLQLKRKTAPPLWVRADITAERDESGAVLEWRVVLMNITREKEAEAQLRKFNETLEQSVADRTAELERRAVQVQQMALDLTRTEDRERRQLAAILHDDFQQDVAYIKLEINRLTRHADTGMREHLMDLAQLAGNFIDKMRHLSYSLNPPALQRYGLLAALEVMAKGMQTHHDLTVTLNTHPGAEPISPIVASMLYRSVRELLFNVVKHAGVNTAVVDARRQEKSIRIKVTDKGKGFDYPAIRNGAGREAGFGLYNIEERMIFLGGSMQATTQPGKGCSIVLTVPAETSPTTAAPVETTKRSARKRPAAAEKARIVARSGDHEKIRVLLVEDHHLMRKGLAELLQEKKDLAVVGEAADGIEAIELADRLKPHVILMDVTMPKLDGIEATTRIMRNHPDVRIIGLSMHDDEVFRQKMLGAGAVDFLTKSDMPETLIETIRRIHRNPKIQRQKPI